MQIQIIATSVETKPTANGKSYQMLEVTYKNLTFQGKVEAKKLMSFGANANAFSTLTPAAPGSTWEVTVVKNDKGYNDWTAVSPSTGAPTQAPAPSAGAPRGTGVLSTPTRSTYETPEERAQRQVLIVRQSSVSSAVAMLSAGAKAPVKLEDVIDIAQKLSDFVFQVSAKASPGPSGFEDLPDFDVPEVS